MSGGAGTRLWPLSTPERPKQFHKLGGRQTLFEATLERTSASAHDRFADPIVLCGASHLPLARAIAGSRNARYVIEPVGRNTAPIAAIAAALAAELDPSALVLLQPADHYIEDAEAFHEALERARQIAAERIVTLGIRPSRPATEYGYIKTGPGLGEGVFSIASFVEKPPLPVAEACLASGQCFWNAGIFLFHPSVLLREFHRNSDIRDSALLALDRAYRSNDEVWLDETSFATIAAAPFDKAVMEHTDVGAVAISDMGWADLGSWKQLWRHVMRSGQEFVTLGSAAASDLSQIEANGVNAIALPGPNPIIVATRAGILVLPLQQAQNLSSLRQAAARLS